MVHVSTWEIKEIIALMHSYDCLPNPLNVLRPRANAHSKWNHGSWWFLDPWQYIYICSRPNSIISLARDRIKAGIKVADTSPAHWVGDLVPSLETGAPFRSLIHVMAPDYVLETPCGKITDRYISGDGTNHTFKSCNWSSDPGIFSSRLW